MFLSLHLSPYSSTLKIQFQFKVQFEVNTQFYSQGLV